MFELFSRRHAEKTGRPEVFIYDSFPKEFRNQFVAIVKYVFHILSLYDHKIWMEVCNYFAREKGLTRLEGKDYVVQDGDLLHIRFSV